MIDGIETMGALGGDNSVNDRFSLTLKPGALALNYLFGEMGLEPAYIGSPFASSDPNGVIVSFGAAGGQSQWYSFQGGWNGFTSATFTLSADKTVVTMVARDAGGVDHTLMFPTNTATAEFLGQTPQGSVVRINGAASAFGLSPAPAPVAEKSSELSAIDSIFANDSWE